MPQARTLDSAPAMTAPSLQAISRPTPSPCGPGAAGPADRCVVCGEPATIGAQSGRLACGHFAFRTQAGVVVGWINTVDMVLNLDRFAYPGITVAPKVNSRTELLGE